MRAGEKWGAEARSSYTWRGASAALGWGQRSDGGQARRCTSMKRAVLRVVQVVGGKRGEFFGCSGLSAAFIHMCTLL